MDQERTEEKKAASAEAAQIRAFVSRFFTSYYTERSCVRIMDMLTDPVLVVGLDDGEVAHSREESKRFIQKQMENVPNSIPYFVTDYEQYPVIENVWNCFAHVDLNVVSRVWGTTKYNIRITFTICRVEGEWKISAIHVSESGGFQSENRGFEKQSEEAHSAAQREIGRIMSQVVPGGIVSRYVNKGSPISIVNDECLRMLHYPTFYDFMEPCSGHFENNIHPDDLEKFQYTVRFIVTSGKQCECEYRIKRRDGSYIWVHDTGRKAVSTDGRDLVVSVLTDMSDKVEQRERLERETETDELTSVYNRRGAVNHCRNWKKPYSSYALLILDIDNFKQVNDLYGHKEGDRALQYLAHLLTEQFGERGIVCRLGGDEFSVFLPEPQEESELKAVLRTLMDRFQAHSEQHCPDAESSISAGGIWGRVPLHMEKAFAGADANLYAVKRRTKNDLLLSELSQET